MPDALGTMLRTLRADRGVSLSELARRSGVGKGTISELENGLRGARLDTLFALTTALDAPLSALLPERAGADAVPVAGASVSAVFLDRWDDGQGLVEAYRATLTTDRQESLAHADGVEETVTVLGGRVRIGPIGHERELGAGESLRYRGDVPHRFQALEASARVVLLMHYPPATAPARATPPRRTEEHE